MHAHDQPSLSQQFAGSAAALAGVAVLLIAALSFWWIDRLQHDAALALQQREIGFRAQQVAQTLTRVEERVRELVDSPLLATALSDSFGRETYLLPYLGGVQTIDGVDIELVLVDFQGNEIARNGQVSFTPDERWRLLEPLRSGRTTAEVSGNGAAAQLLIGEAVRYPRTNTVEGAVWLKLPLARLLQAEGYRLQVGAPPAPDTARLQAAVAAPASMPALQLHVEAAATPVAALHATPHVLAILTGSLLLMAGVAWTGRLMARRLTADLADLGRFANDVASGGGVDQRAPAQRSLEVASLADSINRMLERLQVQHETLQSEARSQLRLLATCIENLNDVVMITEADPDHEDGHRIVFVNPAFTRMSGYRADEVIGRGPKMLQGADTDRGEARRIGDCLRRWQPTRGELLNYTRDGRTYWVELEIVPVRDASGAVSHWVSVERDVTERRSLEKQVREAQKMEAIGTLAGGIAHDFNNILGAILGNVALARGDLAQARSPGEHLEQIARSAQRARSLVHQILTYSRRQQQQRVAVDLRALIDEATALLQATLPARVEQRKTLPPHPVLVMGDPTELTQVVMNLATNAWQALKGQSGVVAVGLDVDGGQARLWVADDGCGIDADALPHIFDPFFTTKPVGAGTGLGLSVVQGIVRRHGGDVRVTSTPGAGTRFDIRLPLAPEGAEPVAVAAVASAAPAGRGERVLYVDDDEVMRSVATALLDRWGYQVTAVASAAEALAAISASDERRYDLVITDFNMPGQSGLDVVRELRRRQAGPPVILTSGFISDEMQREAMQAGASGVLRKENLHDELAPMLAAMLRRPGG